MDVEYQATLSDLMWALRQQKAWTSTEMCNFLNVDVIELWVLVKKAELKGAKIHFVVGERVGQEGHFYLENDHV
ncbi:MAG: hypothetical protein ACK5NC_11525 [Vibrio sp.]